MTPMNQQSSGWPIDVVAKTAGAPKDIDHYGTDLDRVHIFTANPVEYTTPDPVGAIDEQQSKVLTSIEYKVRNKYSTEVEIGEKLVIVLGADGIGTIVSWEC